MRPVVRRVPICKRQHHPIPKKVMATPSTKAGQYLEKALDKKIVESKKRKAETPIASSSPAKKTPVKHQTDEKCEEEKPKKPIFLLTPIKVAHKRARYPKACTGGHYCLKKVAREDNEGKEETKKPLQPKKLSLVFELVVDEADDSIEFIRKHFGNAEILKASQERGQAQEQESEDEDDEDEEEENASDTSSDVSFEEESDDGFDDIEEEEGEEEIEEEESEEEQDEDALCEEEKDELGDQVEDGSSSEDEVDWKKHAAQRRLARKMKQNKKM